MRQIQQRIMDLLNEHIPAKISQNQFCKITGINANSVDKYRAGIAEPTAASLQKLANYFNETFIIEIKPEKTSR